MSKAARRWTWPLGASLLAVGLLCLVLASAAGAAQTALWGSFNAGKISQAPIGAGKGTDIPIPSALVNRPYGTAIDSAAGRVYWANSGSNSIGYANFDGSGGWTTQYEWRAHGRTGLRST
jgi:hypothetical protein